LAGPLGEKSARPHCGLACFIVKAIQDELGDNLRLRPFLLLGRPSRLDTPSTYLNVLKFTDAARSRERT
jgi:hypothetical protein